MNTSALCRFFLLSCLVCCLSLAVKAQEPAMFDTDPRFGNQVQAVRYEQATGYFHYVIPCQQSIEADKRVLAICWPVNAARLYIAEGKLAHTEAVQGTLAVTETQISFLPAKQSDLSFARAIPLAQVKFVHRPGESAGLIEAQEYGIQFGFLNTCVLNCPTATSPLDPNKTSQLDQEFQNVSDSLTQFNVTYKRFHDLALNLRVAVDSANQPTPDDVKPSMSLYSTLNKGLADACAEPAKSCVQSFHSYQDCMSAKSSAECGVAPSCKAACTLSPDVYRHISGGACESALRDGVSIYPDWVPTLKETVSNTQPPPPPSGGVMGGLGVAGMAGMGGMPGYPVLGYGWTSLSGIPDHIRSLPDLPTQLSDGLCSAKQVYRYVSSSYAAKVPPPSFAPLPPPASVTVISMAPSIDAKGQARVSGGVMAGLLVSAPAPVYPPLAKAARVSGTVVLAARISKTGTVEDLTLVSGPPMLVNSAMDAVRQWKYKPYLLNGEPHEVLTTVTVNFAFSTAPAITPQPADSQNPK